MPYGILLGANGADVVVVPLCKHPEFDRIKTMGTDQ